MPNSPNLALPYIAANQAQKHVPHNDALAMIDGIMQLSIVSRGLNAPPITFVDGNRFLVGAAPTAEWLGQAGLIAFRNAGLWQFLTPRKGWALWVEAESVYLIFDGVNWVAPPVPQIMQNMTLLGVNATADATNKLSVGSSAVLFNNIGNGVQLKVNKNALADTASLLYQTGFSGRAEMGATGDDSFHIKVSSDGATWKEGLLIDANTGLARVFANPTDPLGVATKQYVDAGGGGSAGGTSGQIQFKNGTAFGGFTASGDATINTTTGAVTIANAAVSLPKLANLAANSILGNNTASAATPVALTAAQVKTLLAIASSDVTGLGALATAASVNLSTQATGTLLAAQAGALTGDVTSAAGSFTTTISASAVTNAKLATMASLTLKGNNTGGAATPIDLTAAQVKTLIAITTADVSGLGVLATAASVNLSTQATGTLLAAQEPAHTGDVTNPAGSLVLAIAANAVTNAKLATMASLTLKGNNTGGTATPIDLTAAQVKTLIAITTADVSGLGVLATAASVNLSTQATGTLLAAQEPAHTGDVTNAAGSLALAIAANAVTNAKLATMAPLTFKANNNSIAGVPSDLTIDQMQIAINLQGQMAANFLIMN